MQSRYSWKFAVSLPNLLLLIIIVLLLHIEFNIQSCQLSECDVTCPNNSQVAHAETRGFSQPCSSKRNYDWDAFLSKALFQKQIYEQFDIAAYQPDMQGWADITKTFSFHLDRWNKKNPGTVPVRIIEVGSFKGRSTINMAKICKQLLPSRNCTILAVDTWTGSAEHYDDDAVNFAGELAANGGILRLFEKFLKNVKKSGFDEVITPFRLPSLSAAHVIQCYKLRADFIFIDADHEYSAVKQDLYLFSSLLNPGGIIFGDDWSDKWRGVKKAVTEFASEKKLNLSEMLEPATWLIETSQ